VRVDVATERPSLAEPVDRFASVLERAGVPVRRGASEAQVMWSKLARLNALALTTSAADRPLGFIRENPEWRARLEAAVSETVAVARADGADLDAADTMGELEQAHASLGSSMQRDIAAGRTPELDAIAGAVLRAAARHGIEVPTVAELAGMVAGRAGVPVPVV
jgi:2-dehydropantoate 2-reductase